MSVTQNYTINTSSTVLMYIKLAVMTQVRADALAKRTPGEEYDAYLKEQIVTGTEALTALNEFTVMTNQHDVLEGDMLYTVRAALNFALHAMGLSEHCPLVHATEGMTIRNVPRGEMVKAIRFLESPK